MPLGPWAVASALHSAISKTNGSDRERIMT
jgi:hypothetical protein